MKHCLLTAVLLAFTVVGNAQQKEQDSTLRTNNRPVPSTSSAPQIEDAKAKSDREMQAEMNAKDKGTTQKQTEVNPDQIVPPVRDTLRIEARPR